jgi:hypothetical protein
MFPGEATRPFNAFDKRIGDRNGVRDPTPENGIAIRPERTMRCRVANVFRSDGVSATSATSAVTISSPTLSAKALPLAVRPVDGNTEMPATALCW